MMWALCIDGEGYFVCGVSILLPSLPVCFMQLIACQGSTVPWSDFREFSRPSDKVIAC